MYMCIYNFIFTVFDLILTSIENVHSYLCVWILFPRRHGSRLDKMPSESLTGSVCLNEVHQIRFDQL